MVLKRKYRKLIFLGIGVAIFVIVLNLNDISIDQISEVLRGADVSLFLLSLLLGLPVIVLKALRWRVLLRMRSPQEMTIPDAVQLFSIGLFTGALTPGQIGEFYKSVSLKQSGGSLKHGLVATLHDRLLDILALMFLTMWFIVNPFPEFDQLSGVILLGGSMMLFIICSLLLVIFLVRRIGNFDLRIWPLKKVNLMEVFTLGSAMDIAGLLMISALTTLAYGVFSLRLLLLLYAIDEFIEPVRFVTGMGLVSLASILPFSVAGIGIRDAAAIEIFGIFGVVKTKAIAFSMMVLCLHLFNACIGLVFWIRFYLIGRTGKLN